MSTTEEDIHNLYMAEVQLGRNVRAFIDHSEETKEDRIISAEAMRKLRYAALRNGFYWGEVSENATWPYEFGSAKCTAQLHKHYKSKEK